MSVIQSYCCKDSDYCLNYNALRGDFVSVESGEGLDADALDVEAGAAEDVEPHYELGAGGGVDDFAFETHEAAAHDFDAVAAVERTFFDSYGCVGVAEDELECVHLILGDDCGCALCCHRPVGHEPVDVG